MDIELELYNIATRIKDYKYRLEDQRAELNYTSKYFKQYISEITIPNFIEVLDNFENILLDLENRRSDDDNSYS